MIFEASIDSFQGNEAHLRTESNGIQVIKADNVILATGYNLVSRV
jgi:hypothetical protein